MLHQIGIGTLGPVFRTYEPTRDRLVAVKVFRLDIVPEQAQALADALSRATRSSLFHPSIVEPIAAGVEGTVAYRAEEYVAAESLDVAMRHYAPAPLEKALPFITQLAGAIDFARAAGVGHGGLHPRDIFVTPDEARATGFGVVEALEEVGIRAPIRRPYSALERIDGVRWGTPADVFSLAAITFELLTGRRPAGTGAQIGALPTGPHSQALHAVLARAMDDDPSRRYQSALGFAGALEAAGRGEPESNTASDIAAMALPAAVPVIPEPVIPEPTAPPPPVVAGAVPTPGEFEVEQELTPAEPDVALDDDYATGVEEEEDDDQVALERDLDEADVADRTLLEAAAQAIDENANDDIEGEAFADLGEDAPPERFADDFTTESAPAASPLEDPPYVPPPMHAPREDVSEVTMFAAADTDPDPDPHHAGDRSRPVILPFALGVVIGLLGGFGPGYFVGSRERAPVPATDAAPAAAATTPSQAAPAAPTGPATPVTPGQYSEQTVTPPPVAGAPPSPAPVADAPSAAPAARPSQAARGRLVVRSTPSRAGVMLNGTWRGRTPLTIDDLAFGSHVLRVVQPGYAVARDQFTLSARDSSHEFTVRLERVGRTARTPAPKSGAGRAAPAAPAATVFTGTLYVDSRPRGATVFVDNRSVGQTPLSLPDVSIGTHVVRLEMAGKRPWSTTTRVVAGETARVTGSLDDR